MLENGRDSNNEDQQVQADYMARPVGDLCLREGLPCCCRFPIARLESDRELGARACHVPSSRPTAKTSGQLGRFYDAEGLGGMRKHSGRLLSFVENCMFAVSVGFRSFQYFWKNKRKRLGSFLVPPSRW